jgi:hypothetical protein
MADTRNPNPLGLMDDDDRDESIINDIFVTDKDWEGLGEDQERGRGA